MNLKTCILTANDCYKKGTKIKNGKPVGILVHSTGANNKNVKRYVQPLPSYSDYAEIIADLGKNSYGNSWNNPSSVIGTNVCVHAFIGLNAKKEVVTYQTLPYDMCCWGCGSAPYDKNGKKLSSSRDPNFDHYGPSYNYNPQAHIQFEICEDNCKDKTYFDKAFKEAIEYCAYLCKEFHLTAKDICSHKESYQRGYGSNHGDPEHWMKNFGKDMNWFRAEVDKLLKAKEEPEKEPEEEPKKEELKKEEIKVEKDVIHYVQIGDEYPSIIKASKPCVAIWALRINSKIKKVGTKYTIQVAAKNKVEAEKVVAKLKGKGYKAFIL